MRPTAPGRVVKTPTLVPFAALSASYFAHIGFFNPYLPLWLKDLGLPIFTIGLLTSMQSFTRLFAPYAWGALSDHTGERVRLLRYCALVALLVSLVLWWARSPVWLGVVLLLMFTHTSSMMSLTEAAMAHMVAGDWGRYGRVRLWGSAGFLLTVLVAGAWFDHFGMGHFPGWASASLLLVLACTWWVPDAREDPQGHAAERPQIAPVLRIPAVRWFFAGQVCHIMAHFAVYGFLSLYLDSLGYGKMAIGALWAVSVVAEIAWFFVQGRFVDRWPMPRWLLVCSAVMVLRMGMTWGLAGWWWALLLAQALHALTFAAHHTAGVATVSRYFPARLRGRGQALFTVAGYGVGGTTGVLLGSMLASRTGLQAVFAVAGGLALLAWGCNLRMARAEREAAGPAPV